MIRIQLITVLIVCFTQSLLYANVIGPEEENFNPTTDGLDFVTVQSSETLEPGFLNFGLFMDYAVNSLLHFDNTVNYNHTTLNDFSLFGHVNAGVGLAENWDAGLSLPYLINETVKDASYSGLFYTSGLSDISLNTKYRFHGDNSHGFALIASVDFNRVGNNPYTGLDPGPTWNLEAAYDNTFGKWAAGVNAGYRIRQPGNPIPGVPLVPFKNQYIASAAASYLLPQYDTKIIFELFGSYPAQSIQTSSDRGISSLEALAGMKHDFTQNLAFHAGAGTGLFNGTASPDWRVYVGLNWELGPLFGKTTTTGTIDRFTEQAPATSEHFTSGDIIFEFNSDKVTEQGRSTLGKLAAHLMKPPVFKHLVIEGHTDSVGKFAYNQKLSERRAAACKRVLVDYYHIDGSRIETIGYGPSHPIADNGNYQGRKKNRRVEFQITR